MGIAKDKLTELDRIRIACNLFELKDQDKNRKELQGLCPIHGESNPSFSYNYEKDVFHCLSCTASGDLVKLWSKVKGYTDIEGFKAFCNEYGLSDTEKQKKNKELPPLNNAFYKLGELPEPWIKRLYLKRGWTPEIIKKIGIRLQTMYQCRKTGQLKSLKKPQRIAIPIKDKVGNITNVRLYLPGAKKMKIISWGSAYGSAKLFPPTPEKDKTVLLCEGESDTLCALSYGFNAITQTSKPKKWSKDHLKEFKGRDVVIAYDADKAGQKFAYSFAGPQLFNVAKSVRVLVWPDYMGKLQDGNWPNDHGQDLTDFFIKHCKEKSDLQELIDSAVLSDLSEINDKSIEFFSRGVNDRLSFKPRLLADKILSETDLLSDPKSGLLYSWNNEFWETSHENYIKERCIKLLGNESQQSRVNDAVFQATMLSTIDKDRSVNDMQEWICLKNGMFNLDTHELKPHDKVFNSTLQLNISFDPDSKKTCDRWLTYLDETVETQEAIMQLQEFMGYCLTWDTSLSKCLILIGKGADGKSLYLKTLRELVGPENCSAVAFQDLEKDFSRSSLYMKSVNISTEIGKDALKSPYFKAIVTGDPIDGCFKHKDSFTFTPTVKLAFAANELPRVLDNSDGFFRRLLPVHFKNQFKENDSKTDPDLLEKLKDELSEIFMWALVGLERLRKQKRFTQSVETDDIILNYRRLNNPVVCFVEDNCSIVKGSKVPKDDIYKSFEKYCLNGNYRCHSRENFFKELHTVMNNLENCRPSVNGKRINAVKGIQLNVV